MKKETNQTIYKCDYCTMITKSAAAMYSHELSCKKNPHNDILCTKCNHCKVKHIIGEPFSRCNHCKVRSNTMFGTSICEGCIGYEADRLVTDIYECEVSGLKMYHPSVLRYRKGMREEVINQCDTIMSNKADGCPNFEIKED